jgi:hypothetical protein
VSLIGFTGDWLNGETHLPFAVNARRSSARSAELMPYLVKAVSSSGVVRWITRPGKEGLREIAQRSHADVLSTLEDAMDAITKMPRVFTDAGIRFSVVETSEDGSAATQVFPLPAGRPSTGS